MTDQIHTYDLSAAGGPKRITAQELTDHVVRAKTKVKDQARGWSMLSQIEVIALAWFADLLIEDGQLIEAPAKPEPEVISHV